MVMSGIDLAAMADLVNQMTTAAKTLESSAGSIRGSSKHVWGQALEAQKIDDAAAWVNEQIPGLRRRLALAQQIEAQTPGLQPTVQIDEAHISTVAPDVAAGQGADAAKQLKDADGKPSPELVALILKNQNDPYFAAGFAQNASPEALSKVLLDMSRRRDTITRNQYGGTAAELKAWQKQYDELLAGIGGTIGTATRNTGDLAMPAGYAKQWADTITAGPTQPGGEGGPIKYGQAAAAALVLRYGTYSTAFLDTVSTQVYNYEREQGKNGPVWAPRSHNTSGVYIGPYGPDGSPQSDPLANIMHALSRNPQAAQNFFDVGNPNAKNAKDPLNGRPVNDRLKYLIQDRTWKYDNGDGLGNALNAATTTFRDDGRQGEISASIAAQTFALIGDKTKSDPGWKMWTGMRDSVAGMVAQYMPDVFRVKTATDMKADPSGGAWTVNRDHPNLPPGQPIGAALDPTQLELILGTLGENQSDIMIVTTGVMATQQLSLRYGLKLSMDENPKSAMLLIKGDNVPRIDSAAIHGSAVLGWVVDKAYLGEKNHEEAQKKRAELFSKTLGIATSLPILQLPKSVGEWTKFVYDQTKTHTLAEIAKGPKPDAAKVYGSVDEQMQAGMRESTLNLMLQAGYFDPAHYDAANMENGKSYVPPPPNALIGHAGPDGKWVPDQPPQFNFDDQVFRDWAGTYGGTSWLELHVYGPYDRQFNKFK